MEFNKEELNIILGSLNCYTRKDDLPYEIQKLSNELREKIKRVIKNINHPCENCKSCWGYDHPLLGIQTCEDKCDKLKEYKNKLIK